MDGNIWRINGLDTFHSYPSCHYMNLGNALVIGREFNRPVLYADRIRFKSFCYSGHPAYMVAIYDDIPATYLPQVMQDWKLFTSTSSKLGRSYNASIYSFLMSYAANSVITLCLTILAFIIVRNRPHFTAAILLKLGSLITSINMVSTVARNFRILKHQHNDQGVTLSTKIVGFLQRDATFTALNFISITLIQFCQVFLVMRIYERNLEKRVIFYIGSILVLGTNILWVAPQFGTVVEGAKVHWGILPTFVYLFRIAVSSSYASLIISFILRQRKLWYRHLQLSLLTFIVILSVLLSPGFFIADIANVWIDLLGEDFTTTCYLAATFMVWEWLERYFVLKNKNESQSVLGRQIFLDERQEYNFANYSLNLKDPSFHEQVAIPTMNQENGSSVLHHDKIFSTQSTQHTTDAVIPNDSSLLDIESINQIQYETQESQREKMTHKLTHAVNKFLLYTDQAIFKKLGSTSLLSGSISDSSDSRNREIMVRRRIGLDRLNQTYVYNTQAVVFDSDSENEDTEENSNMHMDNNISMIDRDEV